MWKIVTICMFSLMLMIGNPSCFANKAPLTSLTEVMYFSSVPHIGISGNYQDTYIALNHEGLVLKSYLNMSTTSTLNANGGDSVGTVIAGGFVNLKQSDTGNNLFTFPITCSPFFHVYKIESSAGKDFLLVMEGTQSASDSHLDKLWLVGKNGTEYISYATLDTVDCAGLLYENIVPSIENGELKLTGITRDRDCRSGTGWSFKGHAVHQYYDKAYMIVNTMAFFWDEDNKWFGMRYAK